MKRVAVGAVLSLLAVALAPSTADAGGKGQPRGIKALEVEAGHAGEEIAYDAFALNERGVIVGVQTNFTTGQSAPARWVDRKLEVLRGPIVTVGADGTETSLTLTRGDARGVNEFGVVAASVRSGSSAWAALWDDTADVWRPLPRPAGAGGAMVRAINDWGHVVGGSNVGPWLYKDGKTEVLPLLAGTSSCVTYAINNLDMVTGECFDDEGGRAVVWWLGHTTELAGEAIDDNFGRAINDLGEIAGFSGDFGDDGVERGPAMRWSAWRPWDGRILTALGAGNGINNRGDVAGYIGANGGEGAEAPRATVWSRTGRATDLGSLGGQSFARAINDKGVVVGLAETTAGTTVAFVWDP